MPTETGLIDIDHLMCAVSDMPTAVAALERLGFSFTPESAIGGMSNRLVQMRPIPPGGAANFLELMTINDHARVPPLMRDILAGPDGLKMIVHLSDDIDRATAAFAAIGAPIGDRWTVDRDWVSADGRCEHVRFTVLIPRRGRLPFFMNAYLPDSLAQYTQVRYQRHDNGARHIRRVHATCPDSMLAPALAALEELYGCRATTSGNDIFVIQRGEVALDLATEGSFAARFGAAADAGATTGQPRLAGLTIEVADLPHIKALLAKNGVPATQRRGALVVGPEHAAGMMLEFTA